MNEPDVVAIESAGEAEKKKDPRQELLMLQQHAPLPPRRCQHQTSPIPCAHPNCPAGVQGKQLRLVAVMKDGSKQARYYRRRLKATATGVVFEWTPL